MAMKLSYEELEQRFKELEKETASFRREQKALHDSAYNQKVIHQKTPDMIFRFNKNGIVSFLKNPIDVDSPMSDDPIASNMHEFLPREVVV